VRLYHLQVPTVPFHLQRVGGVIVRATSWFPALSLTTLTGTEGIPAPRERQSPLRNKTGRSQKGENEEQVESRRNHFLWSQRAT
jgi:hypothetical protein